MIIASLVDLVKSMFNKLDLKHHENREKLHRERIIDFRGLNLFLLKDVTITTVITATVTTVTRITVTI